jgi:hypothetical protein
LALSREQVGQLRRLSRRSCALGEPSQSCCGCGSVQCPSRCRRLLRPVVAKMRTWASPVLAQMREETSPVPVLMWTGKALVVAKISDRGEGCGWAESHAQMRMRISAGPTQLRAERGDGALNKPNFATSIMKQVHDVCARSVKARARARSCRGLSCIAGACYYVLANPRERTTQHAQQYAQQCSIQRSQRHWRLQARTNVRAQGLRCKACLPTQICGQGAVVT